MEFSQAADSRVSGERLKLGDELTICCAWCSTIPSAGSASIGTAIRLASPTLRISFCWESQSGKCGGRLFEIENVLPPLGNRTSSEFS